MTVNDPVLKELRQLRMQSSPLPLFGFMFVIGVALVGSVGLLGAVGYLVRAAAEGK